MPSVFREGQLVFFLKIKIGRTMGDKQDLEGRFVHLTMGIRIGTISD